jgi:demethylmenaquinone methyltransferase/2-methoxy-6-polyprenyl-1,4-benzoquinol methylase
MPHSAPESLTTAPEEVARMFERISARYDIANDILSLGTHRLWRARVRSVAALGPEDRVLDLCTGTGDLAAELARDSNWVTGADFVRPMLQLAQEKYHSSLTLCHADAMNLPFASEVFDLVTISFGIRNVEKPATALAEAYRVLKKSGRLLILEFGQPTAPIFSSLFRLYSKYLMPALGGLITGDRKAYEYLPRTAAQFPCRAEFVAIMEGAGFSDCSFSPLSFGIAWLYQGRK